MYTWSVPSYLGIPAGGEVIQVGAVWRSEETIIPIRPFHRDTCSTMITMEGPCREVEPVSELPILLLPIVRYRRAMSGNTL
jgi:hypothetical protein